MANKTYLIPRLDDARVLEIFRDLIEKYPPNPCNVDPAGLHIINLVSPNDEQKQLLTLLQSSSSFSIANVGAHYRGMRINYTRGAENIGGPSPLFDSITVERSDVQNEMPQKDRLEAIDLVLTKAGFKSEGPVLREGQTRSLDELDALYRSTVLRLETSFGEQIRRITDWSVEQADSLQKQKLQLAEQTNAERSQMQQEYNSAHEKLKGREDELELKQKTLDDRDYMHARRATRGDIQKVIAERQKQFTLTPQTRRLRIPIHILLIVVVGALLTLNFFNFVEVLRLDWTQVSYVHWWALARQGTLAIATIGALYFYIRWMNRWFEQHAMAELLLKEFQLDIDRASWVVESALEWRRTAQAELPSPLLEGITRNLFVRSTTDAHRVSVADELASALFGSAAGVKLKVGENEVAFTRRGISKLRKAEITEERAEI
jgi:hypothetical protein